MDRKGTNELISGEKSFIAILSNLRVYFVVRLPDYTPTSRGNRRRFDVDNCYWRAVSMAPLRVPLSLYLARSQNSESDNILTTRHCLRASWNNIPMPIKRITRHDAGKVNLVIT